MIEAVGPHRPNHAQIVGALADMAIPLGNGQAGFTVLRPFAGADEQRVLGDPHRSVRALDRRRERLSGVFIDGGLGVERVDMTRSAIHEQEDDAFGGRFVRRGARCQRVPRRHGSGRPVGNGGIGAAIVAGQQVRQRERAESGPSAQESVASRNRSFDVQGHTAHHAISGNDPGTGRADRENHRCLSVGRASIWRSPANEVNVETTKRGSGE